MCASFKRNGFGKFEKDTSIVSILHGTDAFLLEDELNESQRIRNEQTAATLRERYTNGFFTKFQINATATANTFYLEGNDSNPISMIVDGYSLKLGGNRYGHALSQENRLLIELSNADASVRKDLVFLEVWFEVLSQSDALYKFGGSDTQQISLKNIPGSGEPVGYSNNFLDNRVGSETSRRVQLRWRIRSVANGNFTTGINAYKYDNSDSGIQYSLVDGIYVANTGVQLINIDDVKTSELVYAIPLFEVNRPANVNTIVLGDIVSRFPIALYRDNVWATINAADVVEDTLHRFSTDAEKTAWNAKETTTGAQTKATQALTDAKAYASNSVAIGSAADPNTTTEAYILTNHANSPNSSLYWHIRTYFYSSTAGNRAQVAVTYNGTGDKMMIRHFYSGWNSWTELANITPVTTTANGLMAFADKVKLDGIATSANNYTHPVNHPPSIITQDASNRFVTDTEKSTWNAKAPTTAVTTSVNGLMIATDKSKLDGIATSANNYAHPTGDGNLHVPVTSTTNNGKILKAGATAGSISWGTLGFTDMSDVTITSPASNQTLNYNGSAWINSATPNAKAFLNEGLRTSKSTAANQWTKLASVSLTAIGQVVTTRIQIMGGEDSGATGTAPVANIAFRVSQTAAMASAPVIGLRLMENQNITINEFKTVTTTNTVSSTVVDLYVKIVDINETFTYVPTIVNGYSRITFLETQALVTTLPAGTQTSAIYDTVDAAALPSATTSVQGAVILSTSTADTSTTKAATASAVKAAYDLANGKASTTAVTTSVNGLMIAADKSKLDGIAASATNTQNHATNGAITVNGIQQTVYTHPTGAGNNHIPTAGAAGQVLRYSASGTAVWGSVNGSEVVEDSTHRLITDTERTTWNAKASTAAVTTTVNGLMAFADKVKLDGFTVVTTPTANSVLKLDANSKLPASITGNADGNAATATKLATGRTITVSGDVTGSATFDGSANITIATTNKASGVVAGTHEKVTVNSAGIVTSGSNLVEADIPSLNWSKITAGKPTTLAGYGITDSSSTEKITATLPATAGWYRVATSVLGIARNAGRFEFDWSTSSVHGQVNISAGIMYSTDPTLNQLMYSTFDGLKGLTKARIVYHTTYTGNYAYLEVYNASANAITLTTQLASALGWSLITPIIGAIPAGYTFSEITFVDGIVTDTQFSSQVATGKAPLNVNSTTMVTNFNADMVDGIQGASIVQTSRTVSTGAGLTGGGALSANLTISPSWGGNGVATTISRSDHTHTLASAAISDVTISSVTTGEILKWNGTAWINNTLTEAGILSTTGKAADSNALNSLSSSQFLRSDVDTTSSMSLTVNGNIFTNFIKPRSGYDIIIGSYNSSIIASPNGIALSDYIHSFVLDKNSDIFAAAINGPSGRIIGFGYDPNDFGHATVRGGKAIIKFLNGATTGIQIRDNSDLGYDDIYVRDLYMINKGAKKAVAESEIASGMNSITPSASNTPTAITVSFGKTFASVPFVTCTPVSTVAGTVVTGWAITEVTTTNFKLWVTRTSTTSTSLHWIATNIE